MPAKEPEIVVLPLPPFESSNLRPRAPIVVDTTNLPAPLEPLDNKVSEPVH